jgi:hypothetical protein
LSILCGAQKFAKRCISGTLYFSYRRNKAQSEIKRIILKLDFDQPIVETKPRPWFLWPSGESVTLKQILDTLDLAASDPRKRVLVPVPN